MSNAFIDKLRGLARLDADDVALLAAACDDVRDIPARRDLIRAGDPPGPLFVMLDGWACRYHLLPDASRQITAFMIPGDCGDLRSGLLEEIDHGVGTLSPARVAFVPRARMTELVETRPAIGRAMVRAQLVADATLRAWIVSIGRRDSRQRVAHLMCELFVRAANIGLTDGYRLELPLTQTVLSDALGLTPVHINRVLRELRLNRVMEFSEGLLTVNDLSELAHVAGFDDAYLHRSLRRAA